MCVVCIVLFVVALRFLISLASCIVWSSIITLKFSCYIYRGSGLSFVRGGDLYRGRPCCCDINRGCCCCCDIGGGDFGGGGLSFCSWC